MKTIKRILLLCLIVLVVIGGLQIKAGYDKYLEVLNEKLLANVLEELQNQENYTQYEDVPEICYKALVAVEDRRFYIKFENKLAFKFYRFYKTMMELDDIESAYSALLDTAWRCDDKGDETNAKKCRLRMVELFKNFPEEAKNNENNLARHIDVMRRAGLFEEVINEYSDFKASEPIIQEVMSYQLKLSKEKDDKCHRAEECRL